MRKTTTFNTAHKRWLKAQERYAFVNSGVCERMSQAAYDRLVDKRSGELDRATKVLVAAQSPDVTALASKMDALWAMMLNQFRTEAGLFQYGGDVSGEELNLLKSIRRDAARLAKRA